MKQTNYIVIKIGGRPANNAELLDTLIADIGSLRTAQAAGGSPLVPVLVHGGGAEVTELAKRLGIEPVFVNGIRQTSADEMQIVEAVLAGNVNGRLVRRFLAAKIPAVGLSGADAGLFTAESIDPAADSRTGTITKTSIKLIEDLSAASYVPVISSVSCDENGKGGFNINADDAAMAIAVALKARYLVFLSDIPGILKDGTVLTRITPSIAEAEIASGVVSGGMIPKLRSSLGALKQGVGRVVIGGYQRAGDLSGFVNARLGSSIVEE